MDLASSGSKPAMSMVFENMIGPFESGQERKQTDAAHHSTGIPLEQVFHHRGPGLGEIRAVVATAAERQHPTMAQAIRQLRQFPGRFCVRFGRILQMSDRITLQAVSTALKD